MIIVPKKAPSEPSFSQSLPQGESTDQIQQTAQCAVDGINEWDLVIGVPQEAWNFTSLVRELLAIEQVRDESPELQGRPSSSQGDRGEGVGSARAHRKVSWIKHLELLSGTRKIVRPSVLPRPNLTVWPLSWPAGGSTHHLG